MSTLEYHQFICRSDNYGLLLHDRKSGATAAIDAPDAAAIAQQLDSRGWSSPTSSPPITMAITWREISLCSNVSDAA